MAPVDSSRTSVCKICSRPSKYQCPRCHRRTCSLACCRRHKRLYDCSGRRDPTVRLSRAQLTRGDAYDHDYNFLTTIERSFENADREAERRDFNVLVPEGSNAASPSKSHANRLAQEIRANCVRVRQLPNGMSRRRMNNTHWMFKRKQIQWTVEWLHPNGTKSFGQCNSKSQPASIFLERVMTDTEPSNLRSPSGRAQRPMLETSERSKHGAAASLCPTASSRNEPEIAAAPPPSEAASNTSKARSSPSASIHCYLVKPFTRGRDKVLIPIDDKSLLNALRHQEVIEFPTIQILAEPPDRLPAGFILEKNYSGHGIELVAESSSKGREPVTQAAPEPVAPAQVMDSLKKDIAALSA